MKYICSNCGLELNIKREDDYLCPICNSELYSIQFSDEDKEKSVNEYAEKIDQDKINEILDNEDVIKEKISKSGRGGVMQYVEAFFKLIKDPKALMKNKVLVGAALLYVFNPIDVVPDVLPGIGLLDDGAVLMYVFKLVYDSVIQYMGSDNFKKVYDNVKENIKEAKNRNRVILYKFLEEGKNIKYNYEEYKDQGILTLNRKDVERFDFSINNNELLMIDEYYVGHPYFKKTLIKYNNYDSILMLDIFQERIKILRAIGAKKVTCNVVDLTIETKDGEIDINAIEKVVKGEIAASKKSMHKKEESIEENYGDSHSFDDSIIDDLLWFFTKESNFKDIFRSRIMNGLESIKVTTTDRSDELSSVTAKVKIPAKLNIGFSGNKRKTLYREVKFHVDFYELPENIRNNAKEFYEKIENRLNARRIELKENGGTIEYNG